MTLLHVGYAIVVAGLLTGAAALAEAGLRGAGRPARWVWVVALALSTTAPLWGPRVSSRSVATPDMAGAAVAAAGVDAAAVAAPAAWQRVWTRARAEMVRPRAALPWLWWALGLVATTVVGVGLVRLERRTDRLPKGQVEGEEVALSDNFGPALVGLRRPRTVLPKWVLSMARREVELIVAHERAHRAAGDGRVLALGLMAVAACVWNPLIWLQFRRLRDAVEMDCDRRLLREGVAFPAYARVLVLVRLRAAEVGGGAVALVESSSSLERRLRTMRGFTWTRRRVALTGAAALGIMVMACETPAPSAVEVEVDAPAETEVAAEFRAQSGATGSLTETGSLIRLRSPDAEGEGSPGEPLIVVDGVILNQGRLSDVGTLDVGRIEIVKGEAARTIYGERGRNGVVNITTKANVEAEGVTAKFEETDASFGEIKAREVPTETRNVPTGVASVLTPLLKERAGEGGTIQRRGGN